MSIVSSPPPDASSTARGLVSTLAQTWAGVKTFASLIIASAGIQVASLFNSNGTGAGDVCVKVGTSATAHANAKLVSVREQIGGGGEAEIAYFQKTLGLVVGSSQVQPSGLGYFPIATYSNQFRPASANAPAQVNDSFGGNMTGASDIATKLGTTTADASVNSAAKLLSVRTGLGGTEVEKAYVMKDGSANFGGAITFNRFLIDSGVSGFPFELRSQGAVGFQSETLGTVPDGSRLWDFRNFGTVVASVRGSGRIDQSGTDSSGTPGAAIINKPKGISAIAAGASSVVITNSLVTAASHITITPYSRDATCKELKVTPAAGSFTVDGSANATAAVKFSWEVSSLL